MKIKVTDAQSARDWLSWLATQPFAFFIEDAPETCLDDVEDDLMSYLSDSRLTMLDHLSLDDAWSHYQTALIAHVGQDEFDSYGWR